MNMSENQSTEKLAEGFTLTWRYKIGLSMIVGGHVILLIGLVLPFLGMGAAISGAEILAGEVISLASIVFLGIEGFKAIKHKIFGAVKASYTAQVGRTRHYIGIILLCANVLTTYAIAAYAWVVFARITPENPFPEILGLSFDQQESMVLWLFLAGEITFLLAIYVLGADWFIDEAEKARGGNFELVPGMRAQGQKIKKVYVESDYAPLKSVYLANASGFHIPDMDIAWDMANMFAHNIPESKEYMRKHAGKFLGDADPERYAKVVAESDALAKAYRDNGVYVIRNESGVIPKEQIEFSESWSGQKLVGTYAQAAWEVVGNCLINFWEVSAEMGVEFQALEAVVEFFKNDPSAKWMAMPFPVPTSWPDPGPRTSAGDIKIFSEKRIVWGIGVADPSHMTDLSKARSSGDEFSAEIFKRMVEPYGWTVDIVYFNSNYTYHLDCLLAPLREGLLSYPKGSLWTPLPQWLQNWEVIDVSREDNDLGCTNNVPLGNNKIIVCEEAKEYCENLDKAGMEVIPVPYFNLFNIIGSGIHCSSAAIHRES